MSLDATTWVDKTMTTMWSRIVAAAPKRAWVPKHEMRGRKVEVHELGCGHYGCVMPTDDPKVVCKLTTDAAEGAFVTAALSIGPIDDGLVEYHAIYGIPDLTHRKRPMFVLWREAAEDVGFVGRALPSGHGAALLNPESERYDDYEYRSIVVLRRLLGFYKEAAGDARNSLKGGSVFEKLEAARRHEDWAHEPASEFDWDTAKQNTIYNLHARFRGPQRLAINLAVCESLELWMENTYLCDLIGSALRFYREHGLLLADVHAGNIGRVPRAGKTPVITDPGHAIALDRKWSPVHITPLP